MFFGNIQVRSKFSYLKNVTQNFKKKTDFKNRVVNIICLTFGELDRDNFEIIPYVINMKHYLEIYKC